MALPDREDFPNDTKQGLHLVPAQEEAPTRGEIGLTGLTQAELDIVLPDLEERAKTSMVAAVELGRILATTAPLEYESTGTGYN